MVLGTWEYKLRDDDDSSQTFEIFQNRDKFGYKQTLNNGKEVWGDIVARKPENVSGSGDDSPWEFESSLTNGGTIHFKYNHEEQTLITTYRRANTTDWRGPTVARRPNAAGSPGQLAQQNTKEEALVVQTEKKSRFSEEIKRRVSPESLTSHIRHMVLSAFIDSEVEFGAPMPNDASLRNGLSKQVPAINEVPISVFGLLVPLPLAKQLEGEELEETQAVLAHKVKLRSTITPIPSVRLVPKLQHPLSYNEEQMLRLFVADVWNTGYNIAAPFPQKVPLDAEQSWNTNMTILGRHDVLRSAFRLDATNTPYRIVERAHTGGCYTLCTSNLDQAGAINALCGCLPNSLGVSSMRYYNQLSHKGLGFLGMHAHHAVADGESNPLFYQEYEIIQHSMFFGFSEEAIQARLPKLPVQYVDFAYWQRTLNAQGLHDSDLIYWMSQVVVTMPTPILDIPLDLPRKKLWAAVGQTERLWVNSVYYTAIQSQATRATPFAVLVANYGITLARMSGDQNVLVATPFGLRALPSVTNLVGDFVNMLAMNVKVDPLDNYLSILDSASTSSINLHRHALAPLLLLVGVLKPYMKPDPSRNAIYQTMIDCLENESPEPSNGMAGVQDIFIFANTRGGKIYSLDCTYSTTIFEPSTAHRVLMHLTAITQHVARAAKEPVPRLIPLVEEVQGGEPGLELTLAKARLQINSVPHAVAVKSGWDVEGFYPKEYFDIRQSQRLKQVSCLELRNAAGFPQLIAKGQKKPKPAVAPAPAPANSATATPAPKDANISSSGPAQPQGETLTDAPNRQMETADHPNEMVVATPLAETATTTQLELKAGGEIKEVKASVRAKADPKDDRKTDVERRMAEAKRMRGVVKAEVATKRVSSLISLDGPPIHRGRQGRGRAR